MFNAIQIAEMLDGRKEGGTYCFGSRDCVCRHEIVPVIQG